MGGRFEDRVIIVTGASRGIGLAIAHAAWNEGASVVISSRRSDNLDAALSTFGSSPRVTGRVAHAGRRADAEELVSYAIDSFGRLDGLVNNAGTNPHYGALVDIDDALMQKTYEVNQASIVFHTSAAWHQWMHEHGGAIVNVASIGGLGPEPGIGWYNTTKSAVIHLTKQFAFELAPLVRVNAVAPGLVKTELARALWSEHESEIAAQIPLARLGVPTDIAPVVLTLMSADASWVTGQTIVIDGGATTQPSGGVG